jgi:hypothetical protein
VNAGYLAHVEQGDRLPEDHKFVEIADGALQTDGLLCRLWDFADTERRHSKYEAKQDRKALLELAAGTLAPVLSGEVVFVPYATQAGTVGYMRVTRRVFLAEGGTAAAALAAGARPEHGPQAAPEADPLAALRAAVTGPPAHPAGRNPDAAAVGRLGEIGVEAHRLYQAADYEGAARLLSTTVAAVEALVVAPPAGVESRRMHKVRAVVCLAAAKLAAKAGDTGLAWVTADRAHHSALAADLPALVATARRQVACVFGDAGRPGDAERIALTAAEDTARCGDKGPDLLSAHGALLLLAATAAARRGDGAAARSHLDEAGRQAELLGGDGNRMWSAFGPTNVALHATSAALALEDPSGAVATGSRIDTAALPAPLLGRRAQVHLDLAAGHNLLGDVPTATMHLLEAERTAPQVLRFNAEARTLVAGMLGRARGSAAPVLRGVADRAGITT